MQQYSELRTIIHKIVFSNGDNPIYFNFNVNYFMIQNIKNIPLISLFGNKCLRHLKLQKRISIKNRKNNILKFVYFKFITGISIIYITKLWPKFHFHHRLWQYLSNVFKDILLRQKWLTCKRHFIIKLKWVSFSFHLIGQKNCIIGSRLKRQKKNRSFLQVSIILEAFWWNLPYPEIK